MTGAPSRPLLLISTSYPESADGSEAAGAFVADFAATAARRAPVYVLAPGRQAGRSTPAAGLTVVRFAAPRLPLSLLRPADPRDWAAIVATLRAGARAVDELAREARPGHLLALWALPSGAWARRAGRLLGIPYSTWALGSDIWTLGRVPLVRGFLRTVLRDATLSFADGYALADAVRGLSGKPCEFLTSSRTLAPVTAKVLARAAPYKLAFLGRWHPNKGPDLMLQALAQLGDEDWSRIAAVRIAGGGPLHAEVVTGIETLRRAGRPVEKLGYLDREAARALLEWADWLLLPSRVESIPVVFSDALQTRCPIVATPVGDLPRLMQGARLGVLAEAVTPAAFAGALRQALRGPPPAERGGALQTAAAEFGVDRSVERFFALAGKAAA